MLPLVSSEPSGRPRAALPALKVGPNVIYHRESRVDFMRLGVVGSCALPVSGVVARISAYAIRKAADGVPHRFVSGMQRSTSCVTDFSRHRVQAR